MFVAVFLPHSESGFGEGAAFRRRSSIQKKEQHSEFVLKKSSIGFEEGSTAHLKVFILIFPKISINFCIEELLENTV